MAAPDQMPDLHKPLAQQEPFKQAPRTMASAEVRTVEGKLYLFVALDRTCKFAVARLYDEATRPTACQFLEELIEVVP